MSTSDELVGGGTESLKKYHHETPTARITAQETLAQYITKFTFASFLDCFNDDNFEKYRWNAEPAVRRMKEEAVIFLLVVIDATAQQMGKNGGNAQDELLQFFADLTGQKMVAGEQAYQPFNVQDRDPYSQQQLPEMTALYDAAVQLTHRFRELKQGDIAKIAELRNAFDAQFSEVIVAVQLLWKATQTTQQLPEVFAARQAAVLSFLEKVTDHTKNG